MGIQKTTKVHLRSSAQHCPGMKIFVNDDEKVEKKVENYRSSKKIEKMTKKWKFRGGDENFQKNVKKRRKMTKNDDFWPKTRFFRGSGPGFLINPLCSKVANFSEPKIPD